MTSQTAYSSEASVNKNTMRGKRLQTQAVHGGEAPNATTGASSPELVMSSTFVVDEEVSFSANNLTSETPFVYTRWDNPTTQKLEQKLALLEQTEACLAFASGMAASCAVLLANLSQGDHLVISNTNYPGTAEFARETLTRLGVQVSPVDTSELEQIRNAMQDNTRMVWVETPSNPLLRITDIAAAAEIAHAQNALLVVDSTFASPIATRPATLGADLVVHSLTKYIGGHGDAMGGAVCGVQALLGPLRGEALVHYGGVISPFNAWLILRGMATLPLRMRCHEENAFAVARYLEQQPSIELLRYPGLESHPQHTLAKTQMDNFSGMICFRTRTAARQVAARMMRELEVIHYAVSLGHHRSLVYLMQTDDLIESSYRLEGGELERYREIAGDGVFRLSVGLEDAQDLIEDLERILT